MAMTQGRRSLVTMVVALALAGGMGAFAYYGVLKSEEAKTKQNEEAAKIFTFDKSKVQQVSLTEKGVSSVMKKTPDGWVFVAADAKPGVAVRADKAVVDTIIDKI